MDIFKWLTRTKPTCMVQIVAEFLLNLCRSDQVDHLLVSCEGLGPGVEVADNFLPGLICHSWEANVFPPSPSEIFLKIISWCHWDSLWNIFSPDLVSVTNRDGREKYIFQIFCGGFQGDDRVAGEELVEVVGHQGYRRQDAEDHHATPDGSSLSPRKGDLALLSIITIRPTIG